MGSTVVVGYDHMPSSEQALLEAAQEAAWRGVSLTVVTAFQWLTAVPPMAYSPLDVEHSVRKAAVEVADHGAELARSRHPGLTVRASVQDGPSGEVLAAAARAADLLVVGNRGRGGFAGMLLGSVSMRALDDSSVPVMVVRGPEREPRGLVVAAVDALSPGAEPLRYAFAEAARRGARLEVLHAWDSPWFLDDDDDSEEAAAAARQIMGNLRAELEAATRDPRADYPDVPVTVSVSPGSSSTVLNVASRRADLIVVGAHRRRDERSGMRVGPVAHGLLHQAECPVVVVPRG